MHPSNRPEVVLFDFGKSVIQCFVKLCLMYCIQDISLIVCTIVHVNSIHEK